MDAMWQIERSLWLEGVEAYERSMADQCIMAFAPMGVLQRDAVVESLREAPRWQTVSMTDQVAIQPVHDVAVLSYTARAQRAEGQAYLAICSSTYIRTGDGWRIVQHQQTPLG